MKKIKIKDFFIGEGAELCFICGPCVIESREFSLQCAEELKEIFSCFPSFNFIYKSSFDKANRSSITSFRGPGLETGLDILNEIKQKYNIPIITDIHTPSQAEMAANICDMLQIPAFLCRQTDLLISAAKTNKPINIKKAQFLSPLNMQQVIEKLTHHGNDQLLLTDRGTCFGYNNLISDFRSIPIMKKFGFPVCFDASHSVQMPGSLGDESGGQSEFIPILAKAAIAVGSNALFIESHPTPSQAKSDSTSMISFKELKKLLKQLHYIYEATKKN